jgi:HAMP domain-containing protein
MNLTRTRALLMAPLALLMVAVPLTARADCPEPSAASLLAFGEERGQSAFIGSVIEGGNQHRARMVVEEVWSGPDLAPVVLVRTGPEQLPWPLSTMLVRNSSVDADLGLGEQYLVATHGDFATDFCSSMVADADVLAQVPDDARPPTDGASAGHQLGLFDTALGATLLLGLIALAVMVWMARRLDARRTSAEANSAGRQAARGAVVGAVVGLLGAAVGELATEATRQLFPTDIGIVGFTYAFGAPASVVVGALLWWRGRPASTAVRLVLVALPVVAVAALQVVGQWMSQ